MILNFVSRLLRPPTFANEDKTRSARILNVVMWSCLVFLTAYSSAAVYFAPRQPLRLWLLALVAIFVGLSLLLLRRGWLRLSGTIFTAVIWLVMTVVFFFSGGINAPQFSGYLVVALMVGLLINGRLGIAYALVSSLVGLIFVWLEQIGRLPPPQLTHTDLSLWGVYTLYFLVATMLLHLTTEAIRQALAQTRRSARALTEKNIELEEIRRFLEEGRTELATTNEELSREIAERRQAQQALAASEERHRSIVNNARDAIYILDTEGTIISLNPAFETITGWKTEECLGKSFVLLVHSDDLPVALNAFDQVLAGNSPSRFELRIRTTSNNYRVCEFTVTPQWSEGNVVGLLGIARDVTERNQAEESLRQMQKLDSLGVLAGGVAHDFNNLLVAMMGQTSLALLKMRPDHSARSHIEKSMKATERAADLTRQLLAYSGRGQFEVRPVDLNELIQQNLHLFEVAIPKNIALRLTFLPQPAVIEADSGQMQQVIMNLLLNGVQAIGEKRGIVTVVTGRQTITGEEWRYWQKTGRPLEPGYYITLEIHDTGQGMNEATTQRIFDPFFTTKPTGHGLGLAAVQGIVRGHKGGMRVYSMPNEGTTFKLLFPAFRDGEVKEVIEERTKKTVASGTILVIDDETAILEAVTDILQDDGWQVLTASSGRQGLDIYREQGDTIDLILLDLSMPGMNGEETFRALRQHNSQARIILSSGYNEVEATHRFVGKGLAGFVQKPYNAQQLRQIVEQEVQRS
ncbi:MAG: PAS domain S-box protein [Chloroflexota bacterium]